MGLLRPPLLNNRSSQKRFPRGVFPSFRLFYPLLSYLVLKKRRWVGTGACSVPEIRLKMVQEEGSGERAVPGCFPLFFGATGFTEVHLTSSRFRAS